MLCSPQRPKSPPFAPSCRCVVCAADRDGARAACERLPTGTVAVVHSGVDRDSSLLGARLAWRSHCAQSHSASCHRWSMRGQKMQAVQLILNVHGESNKPMPIRRSRRERSAAPRAQGQEVQGPRQARMMLGHRARPELGSLQISKFGCTSGTAGRRGEVPASIVGPRQTTSHPPLAVPLGGLRRRNCQADGLRRKSERQARRCLCQQTDGVPVLDRRVEAQRELCRA